MEHHDQIDKYLKHGAASVDPELEEEIEKAAFEAATKAAEKAAIMPHAAGRLRLSEEDYLNLMPAELLKHWPTMPESQKQEVRDIIANTEYLKNELDTFEITRDIYKEQLAEVERKNQMLEETIKNRKIQTTQLMKKKERKEKKLEETEDDLISFKNEVQRQLRVEKEVDLIKSEIAMVKKAQKEVKKKILKRQKKNQLQSS